MRGQTAADRSGSEAENSLSPRRRHSIDIWGVGLLHACPARIHFFGIFWGGLLGFVWHCSRGHGSTYSLFILAKALVLRQELCQTGSKLL